jgi:mevalonate kinase
VETRFEDQAWKLTVEDASEGYECTGGGGGGGAIVLVEEVEAVDEAWKWSWKMEGERP